MNGSTQAQAPAIVAGRPFSLEQVIEMQREFKRTGNYLPLGRIMTCIFERLEGEKCPPPDTDIWGRSLEYDRSGPLLALSPDRFHLLVIGAFPLQLPDVPDPKNQTGPRIPQRYADRSDKHLRGTDFVIFEPLFQLLADPVGVELPGTASARPPLVVQFRADGYGQYPALLIHSANGDGYIANGAFELLS